MFISIIRIHTSSNHLHSLLQVPFINMNLLNIHSIINILVYSNIHSIIHIVVYSNI